MKHFAWLLFGFMLAFSPGIFAQGACWVFFKDKKDVTFNPYTYFDPKAIERRIRNGIPLDDPSDWPVNEKYEALVGQLADSSLFTSRWLNAMAIYAGPEQVEVISKLSFVSFVEKVQPASLLVAGITDFDTILSEDDSATLQNQLLSLQGNLFREKGIDGKGVRIAIFDVGFPGARNNPAFQQIIADGRLIATKDFTKRKGDDVFWGKSHGTNVWSCVGGMIGDKEIGLATGAEFLLAKTEVNKEPFSEELHWMAAAEWADKNGADIINSSLGYTFNRYFPWQMDGRTSYVTRAANIAARKGMLVVNAAGNEGDEEWHKIGAPADADSVLSIGGIDPETGFHTSFSSFGPTADKRMKPNVSAYGHVIVSGGSGLTGNQGTSFASPLVAGFAACVLQMNKGMKNMDLFKEIEKSGHLYPYFDYAHGYGIPQAGYFTDPSSQPTAPTFTVEETPDSIKVFVNPGLIPDIEKVALENENKVFNKNQYFYYNIMNRQGVLDTYFVLAVTQSDVLLIDRHFYTEGETLNIHFAGYSTSIKL